MSTDIPWIADGVRDRGERRDEMHELFAAKLRELGLLYVEVSGGREERFALAVQATQSALMRSKGRDGAQI